MRIRTFCFGVAFFILAGTARAANDGGASDFEVAPGGSRPSPRNAAAMVQLRPKRGGGGQGVPGQGGQGAEFLLFGGWRAFVESYASTHVLRVEVGASA